MLFLALTKLPSSAMSPTVPSGRAHPLLCEQTFQGPGQLRLFSVKLLFSTPALMPPGDNRAMIVVNHRISHVVKCHTVFGTSEF